MSEREAVKEWLIANCMTCGKPFGQEEAWMENCPICFKESKGYKLLKGDLAFACLQEEVARLRAVKPNPARAPDGDVERLREEIEDLVAKGMAAEARVERLQKHRQKLKAKIDELEGEVARLRHEISMKSPAAGHGQALDLPLLRKLLLLCHPDKNPNNLALATEVTQWLLAQKSKINP